MAESRFSLVSVDIETTGPTPATGEMCSIGAVMLDEELEINGDRTETFYINLEFRPDPKIDEDTMKWWEGFPQEWEMHRRNPVEPFYAMDAFDKWLKEHSEGKPQFVAWPVGFDWGFVNYYFHAYLGRNPFGYSPMCLKNYAAGVLRNPGMLLGNREETFMPEGWLVEPQDIGFIKHHALGDAMAQAHMIQRIMRYTG